MLDSSSYLSGEVRNLAFRKADEHTTWQDAVKQQQANETENRLYKVFKSNPLANLSRALLHPFIHSKHSAPISCVERVPAHQPTVPLGAKLPSHHKAG
jgi:hypothetical protein